MGRNPLCTLPVDPRRVGVGITCIMLNKKKRKKIRSWASEMAQHIKVLLVTKPDSLSSISRIHMVGKKWFPVCML